MSHKRNEALRHVQHSMHHVIAAGEGSDRAPDSCKLCPYYRPDFKFRTCLYAHCPYKKQVNVFRSTPEKWDILYVSSRFYGFSQPSQIDLSLPYDIALLDIDMGETNGIELARKLRASNENIVIIFITNFIQYAPEGFEVQAFRYLLKADLSAKLDSYFDSAVQEVLRRKQLVTISINSEIIDVPVNDILYLESHRRIVVMHLLDEKSPAYQFYGNITELSEKIEPLGFLRIQKSYLVNMHYVEIFQYNKVQLRGGLCLAPSEKNYSELKQKYLHWRGKSRSPSKKNAGRNLPAQAALVAVSICTKPKRTQHPQPRQ